MIVAVANLGMLGRREDHLDQIKRILVVLGTPTEDTGCECNAVCADLIDVELTGTPDFS